MELCVLRCVALFWCHIFSFCKEGASERNTYIIPVRTHFILLATAVIRRAINRDTSHLIQRMKLLRMMGVEFVCVRLIKKKEKNE